MDLYTTTTWMVYSRCFLLNKSLSALLGFESTLNSVGSGHCRRFKNRGRGGRIHWLATFDAYLLEECTKQLPLVSKLYKSATSK